MSRIDLTFKRLREKGQTALIPFIVVGDPDLAATEALIVRMAENGADIIELGVPFSDPFRDGPTIQAAHQRALKNGIKLREIFRLTEKLKGITAPLILMTYFRPIFQYGLIGFVGTCKKNGIDGVIIPDLSPKEAGLWIEEAWKRKLDTIFLTTPTSPPEHLRWVNRFSRGFIYHASITGVTGARGKLPEDLEWAVRRVKKYSQKPVAVGFGISTPEQAKIVSRLADGVIVGSAIVKIIEESLNCSNLVTRVGKFISSLAKAVKS